MPPCAVDGGGEEGDDANAPPPMRFDDDDDDVPRGDNERPRMASIDDGLLLPSKSPVLANERNGKRGLTELVGMLDTIDVVMPPPPPPPPLLCFGESRRRNPSSVETRFSLLTAFFLFASSSR